MQDGHVTSTRLTRTTFTLALMDSSMDVDVDEHFNASSCPHFASLAQDLTDSTAEPVLSKFKLVASWGIKQYTIPSSHPRKRRKVSMSPICGTCSRSLHRPYSCLHCDYIGCWSNGHISTHLVDSDHTFSADARSCSLYCSKCDSFVYHSIIDDIVLNLRLKEEEQHTDAQVGPDQRVPYRAWEPDPASLQGYSVIPCQHRRGLLNLGQTCFLNCVLQSFIHNPLLRNFFLSDKHNHVLCNKGKDCTCCEMDKLFGEIFSGESTPYAPAELLQTTWRTSSDLAGYAQQDAHEFFMSMLNQIHSSSRGSTNISCNCIIHSTFQGSLQSDVKCEKCGNVTTAVDPLLDISLELKGKGAAAAEENTLAACLRRFTKSEKLGSKEYSCAKCGKASHVSVPSCSTVVLIQLEIPRTPANG
jgi:ubiquitin carboxyl-terminal hydrolase 22/27/51